MLVSDSHLFAREIEIKVISPDGDSFIASFSEDTILENIKIQAISHFYGLETVSSRYKLVRVSNGNTLQDYSSIAQAGLASNEEVLLVERQTPEATTLWDLGAVRAPQPAAIASATAAMPTPAHHATQPDLQSLLFTNELPNELRKILISLIEVGAMLAAGGRNYEMTLSTLSAALDEPKQFAPRSENIITPNELAKILKQPALLKTVVNTEKVSQDDPYKRAKHLQNFLAKFHEWVVKTTAAPTPEAIVNIEKLGFSNSQAIEALKTTGCNEPAAAAWLMGERSSSIYELINGLPNGAILEALIKQPVVQRGLLNTKMLIAFIGIVGKKANANLWLNAPHGGHLLSQILRTYHAEKYCSAVNQFSPAEDPTRPSTSRRRS